MDEPGGYYSECNWNMYKDLVMQDKEVLEICL